jgi:hypothetical protein
MTGWRKRTIMEMAREAEFELDCVSLEWHKRIEAFAEMVRADEREACIVDIQWHIPRAGRHTPEYQMALRMIERIRAKGQA